MRSHHAANRSFALQFFAIPYHRGGPAYNCRQPFRRRQLYRFLRKP